MQLRQIRYFVAAAEAESVTRAAHELAISQSAITAAIQMLEGELGAPLFVRHAKGMALTHEGHQFLAHARRILAAVSDARLAVGSRRDAVVGDLNLGVTGMVSGYYLADLLARFTRVFPGVQVQVVEDSRDYLEHLLVNGELDVGLMLVSNLRDRQALEWEILVRSPWRVWLPAAHPLLAARELTLSEVAVEPQIMLTVDELADTTALYWRQAGLSPRVAMRTASMEAVRSLVGMGVGIATLPDMAYRPWSLEGDRLEVRDLADPVATVDVGLAWRRGAPLRPPARQFIEVSREHVPPHARRRPAG